jgi:post-GPI attachment to proteins factor 2
MIPQFYERLGTTAKLVIPMGKFTCSVVALPLGAFIFSVIWSLLFFFERSTATHCHVDNYLPSVSATIGNYQPQRFVWQLCIVVQFLPRLAVAYLYNQYNEEMIRKNRRFFSKIAYLFNVVENFALLGLSLWTSVDDYSEYIRESTLAFERSLSLNSHLSI